MEETAAGTASAAGNDDNHHGTIGGTSEASTACSLSEGGESSTTTCSNNKPDLSELKRQVESFLLFFQNDVAGEYREAMERAPHLVRQESPISNFLKTERGHTWRAAKRLAFYWKLRKQLYGKERWLLPMNQTGRGCLSDQDVAVLRTGFLSFVAESFVYKMRGLPSPDDDPQQQQQQQEEYDKEVSVHKGIWIIDRSRLPFSAGTPGLVESFGRIIFYVGTIRAYAEDFILHVIHRASMGDIFFFPPELAQQLTDALCCAKRGMHLVRAYEEPSQQPLLDLVARGTLQAAERMLIEIPIEYIAKDSSRETLDTLLQRGYQRCVLPRHVGGDYDYSLWDEWIRSRLSIEEIMGSAAPVPNAQLANSGTSVAKRNLLVYAQKLAPQQQQSKPAFQAMVKRLPHESDKEFARRRTIHYSKRARDKNAEKHKALFLEHKQLERQNEALQADNAQLEGLLAKAKALVEDHSQVQMIPQVFPNDAGKKKDDGTSTIDDDPLPLMAATCHSPLLDNHLEDEGMLSIVERLLPGDEQNNDTATCESTTATITATTKTTTTKTNTATTTTTTTTVASQPLIADEEILNAILKGS